jgi:Fe-S-cluster containining protein
MSLVPECTRCAACCTSRGERHVPVTGDDYARLGDDAERLTTWEQNRVFMRMTEGRCAALAIDADRALCSIYERRPSVCRELERGSPACEAEILRKGSPLGAWGEGLESPSETQSARRALISR